MVADAAMPHDQRTYTDPDARVASLLTDAQVLAVGELLARLLAAAYRDKRTTEAANRYRTARRRGVHSPASCR